MNPILYIKNLSFSYNGKNLILNNLSLTLEYGSVLALVGPNGSGKSTLIKNIFDILQKDSGRILINNVKNNKVKAKKNIMYMSDNNSIPDFLTGREYININMKMYDVNINKKDIDKYITRYALTDHIDSLIEGYSHGMKKKLQLITAFLLRRPLTIIDETLNGVDLEALYLAEEDISLLRFEGFSIILCSHDIPMLSRVADSVLVLVNGEIVEHNKLGDIIDKYGSLEELISDIVEGLKTGHKNYG
jgi:ABC superfamily ATP binding cassette transporter